MTIEKLKEYLDSQKVGYIVLTHSPAFRAQDVAESAHIPGQEVAKTVIVWMEGKMTMVVLPASYMIDFTLLKAAAGATNVELANESDFKDRFPECEVGAMPPFGSLFDMNVYVETSLTQDKEIAFNACSHRELVRMPYADFARLEKPRVAQFSFKKKSLRDAENLGLS